MYYIAGSDVAYRTAIYHSERILARDLTAMYRPAIISVRCFALLPVQQVVCKHEQLQFAFKQNSSYLHALFALRTVIEMVPC